MNVADIMTRDVIAVPPSTPIHDAARLMIDHGVSGLPVVDARGTLTGIITEGDLIVRQKWPPLKQRRSWRTLFFSDAERLAREYQRATGLTVAEVMTRDVVCVGADWPIESVASMLDRLHIRRLPVVDAHGQLIGIVSRADLIKALAVAPARSADRRADADLAAEMRARLEHESWVSDRRLFVEAVNGVLLIWGTVESEGERSAIRTMARAIDGCRDVDGNLVVSDNVPAHAV
jgi:CBS domain-containing protein